MQNFPLRRLVLISLLCAGAAGAADNAKSVTGLARAAEEAAARARYEQTEREVEAMLRARREAIRRESGIRVTSGRRQAVEDDGVPARPAQPRNWSYEGETGPENWGRLRPEWAKCGNGSRQSPIDIRDGIPVELEPVVFDYKPSAFNVIDTGHTIRVNMGPGNRISLTGRSYELVEFHFHRPSEEKINGRSAEMVAHLVHKDAEGRQAVVAVLIDSGNPHPLIQTVWNNLPLEKNEAVVPVATMDAGQLLPQRRDYYTYMGSMTTPPCSEGVLWIVMKEAVQASAQQIGIFSRLYPMNARPVQPSAGRLIKESL